MAAKRALPKFSSVDLNLLIALDALMREGNVTAAGRRIGLSQPAMSHALVRLRDLLGDPLLVRERQKKSSNSVRILTPVRPADARAAACETRVRIQTRNRRRGGPPAREEQPARAIKPVRMQAPARRGPSRAKNVRPDPSPIVGLDPRDRSRGTRRLGGGISEHRSADGRVGPSAGGACRWLSRLSCDRRRPAVFGIFTKLDAACYGYGDARATPEVLFLRHTHECRAVACGLQRRRRPAWQHDCGDWQYDHRWDHEQRWFDGRFRRWHDQRGGRGRSQRFSGHAEWRRGRHGWR